MNNTFELKRFGLVFKKLLFERALHLIGSFALALFSSWLIYTLTNDISVDTFAHPTNATGRYSIRAFQVTQMQAFAIGLAVGGLYWVFVGFNYFSNKEEGYNYLTLPASYLEKWLSTVTLFGLFFAIFCLFFRILDIAYIQYLNDSLNNVVNMEAKIFFFKWLEPLGFWKNRSEILQYPYFIFFNITGLMAIGTLYFNKAALIKTVFLAICLEVLYHQVRYSIAKNMFQLDIRMPFAYWNGFAVEKTYEKISFPPHIQANYAFAFCVILPIVFWLIALVRMREKEI